MDEALYREMAELERGYWWFVAKRRIVARLIDRSLKGRPGAGGDTGVLGGGGPARVCDIGCGCGALLGDLAAGMGVSRRYAVVGVDSSSIARRYCAERGIEAVDGTLPDGLGFPDASFDAVVLSDVLEHIKEDRETVARVTRLLRPGGVLVCTVPAHPWMWTARDAFHHHQRRYRRAEYGALFEQGGLEREVLSPYNAGLFPVMAAVRLGKKALGRDEAAADIRPLPGPVNGLLRAVFEMEKHVLPWMPLPFGASLISVHRRTADAPAGGRPNHAGPSAPRR